MLPPHSGNIAGAQCPSSEIPNHEQSLVKLHAEQGNGQPSCLKGRDAILDESLFERLRGVLSHFQFQDDDARGKWDNQVEMTCDNGHFRVGRCVYGHEEHVEQRLITGFAGSQLAHGRRQPVQDVGQVTQVGFQAVWKACRTSWLGKARTSLPESGVTVALGLRVR